jgi:hypothetical protein
MSDQDFENEVFTELSKEFLARYRVLSTDQLAMKKLGNDLLQEPTGMSPQETAIVFAVLSACSCVIAERLQLHERFQHPKKSLEPLVEEKPATPL